MTRQKSPYVSFVIPVYNAAETIGRLLDCLASITEFETEIILIDDASSDGSRDIIRSAGLKHGNIIPIFNDVNAGAGHSRNIGFAACSGRYTIFLDADDIFHEKPIYGPLTIMDGDEDIDVSIFQYRYTDSIEREYQGMSYVDERIFENILGRSSEKITDVLEFPEMLRITNYPWNKIIRRSRYDGKALFGLTKVHNDILAHWNILLNSRRILVLQSQICTHLVPEHGNNITNISSRTRLELFEALGQTYALLQGYPALKQSCVVPFWDLAVTLAAWARTRMEDDVEFMFHEAYKNLIERMDLEDLLFMRNHGHHAVADRILDGFFTRPDRSA